jgi:hypothetical protein
LVESGDGGGERGARVVVEAVEACLQDLRARGAHLVERLAAGLGDLDPDGAGVGGVARLAHEPFLLEPAHEHGHGRLRDKLGCGQVRDPLRPVVVEPAQREQRAEAAPAVGAGAQQLRDPRDAAVQLGGEIRGNIDRATI